MDGIEFNALVVFFSFSLKNCICLIGGKYILGCSIELGETQTRPRARFGLNYWQSFFLTIPPSNYFLFDHLEFGLASNLSVALMCSDFDMILSVNLPITFAFCSRLSYDESALFLAGT